MCHRTEKKTKKKPSFIEMKLEKHKFDIFQKPPVKTCFELSVRQFDICKYMKNLRFNNETIKNCEDHKGVKNLQDRGTLPNLFEDCPPPPPPPLPPK